MSLHDNRCEGCKTAFKQLVDAFPYRFFHHVKDVVVECYRQLFNKCPEKDEHEP